MTGVWVLAAVAAVAAVFGAFRVWTDGRWRSTPLPPTALAPVAHGIVDPPSTRAAAGLVRLTAADIGEPLGARATLVQFSTAFCAPCRTTRVVLARVAGEVAGVVAVDVDAESHLDLVRRLDIRRTPTTFVLDSAGAVRGRAVGAARRPAVLAALSAVLAEPVP